MILNQSKFENLIKVHDYICLAPIVYHSNAFYVFGGDFDFEINGDQESNIIGRLDASTMTWTKAGELVYARQGHGAIFNGDVFIVAGGEVEFKTEACSINYGEVNCVAQAPTLWRFQYYPEMFLVDENFCKDI